MSDLKEAVEAARQRWNAGDLDGYLALYDPAIKLYGYAPEPFDRAAVRAFYEMIFGSLSPAGKPSPHLEFHETMVEGDLYTCRFTMTGAQSGSFLGFPASGKPYALNGITILRFGPNRKTVIERHSCADMLGLLVQIGALTLPGA